MGCFYGIRALLRAVLLPICPHFLFFGGNGSVDLLQSWSCGCLLNKTFPNRDKSPVWAARAHFSRCNSTWRGQPKPKPRDAPRGALAESPCSIPDSPSPAACRGRALRTPNGHFRADAVQKKGIIPLWEGRKGIAASFGAIELAAEKSQPRT